MRSEAKIILWEDLVEGSTRSLPFHIQPEDMVAFAALSNDYNPIHIDESFARAKNMTGPVVYGGLLLARLSHLIGMEMPGRDGVWTSVSIDFVAPLYVGEPAVLDAEITLLSEATRCVELRVRFKGPRGLIAKGSALVVFK